MKDKIIITIIILGIIALCFFIMWFGAASGMGDASCFAGRAC